MHTNFYHWHANAEIKPDPSILQQRWNAAVKFAEKCSADDLCSLLKLVAFSESEPSFAARFTEALVKLEPTFKPERNLNLLRVMATAAVYSKMDRHSNDGHAVALGLKSTSFPPERIQPVTQDIISRGEFYLLEASEHVRPAIYSDTMEKAEKSLEAPLEALKQAVEDDDLTGTSEAMESLAKAVVGSVKESHSQLGKVIGRLAEESQFLWWLIGKRSPSLGKQRDQLPSSVYAIPGAAEAADRVTLLPPAESVESLLETVLLQCQAGTQKTPLSELITCTDAQWIQSFNGSSPLPEFTPVTSLLIERQQNAKSAIAAMKKLNISPKDKFTPLEVSRQFFRELMFIRSIKEIK